MKETVGIEEVRTLAMMIRHTEAALVAAVIAARNAGFTWRQIGSALGMSKQSAWERFRAAVPTAEIPARHLETANLADPRC